MPASATTQDPQMIFQSQERRCRFVLLHSNQMVNGIKLHRRIFGMFSGEAMHSMRCVRGMCVYAMQERTCTSKPHVKAGMQLRAFARGGGTCFIDLYN
jgi:hypothetical protein